MKCRPKIRQNFYLPQTNYGKSCLLSVSGQESFYETSNPYGNGKNQVQKTRVIAGYIEDHFV